MYNLKGGVVVTKEVAELQKIIDNHGGKIWVESTPNIKTVFIFTLPIAKWFFEPALSFKGYLNQIVLCILRS